MNHRCSPVDAVRVALDGSELIRDVRCVKQDAGTQLALGTNSIRPLSAEEIEQLEVQGNVADDWSRVQVADSFGCL